MRIPGGCVFASILLLGLPAPALAQCVTGPVQHTLTFEATATEDLDRFVFWDPSPEMFLHVYVGGALVCDVDGLEGWTITGTCAFDIPEPYDPTEIELELMDSDVPFADYTVDVNPGLPQKLKFVYDPMCGTIQESTPGEIPGCPAGNHLPECRGPRTVQGGEANITFEVGATNDVPLVESSLSITNMETIQVVPNPTRIVTDRPTVVRLDVGSSHAETRVADVTVTVRDRAGTTFTHQQFVAVPPCGSVPKVTFFGPSAGWRLRRSGSTEWEDPGEEAGFRPEDGPFNLFTVSAEIDPAADCAGAVPPCQPPADCRIVDGQQRETELQLVAARSLEVGYRPFLHASRPICADDLEETMPPIADAAAKPLIEDLFPINTYIGHTSTTRLHWPLPAGEPLLDLADNLDPRPGLMLLELPMAIAGVDRLSLVTYEGGLQCHWASLDLADAPGAAAGNLSRVSLSEPRHDFDPYAEVVVHEVAHTFDLSEAACPIDGPLAWFRCEDEDQFDPSYTVPGTGGVPSRGVQVLRWVAGASVPDMDGKGCIMGSSSVGTPDAWIDTTDYERLLDHLTTVTPLGDALFLRVRLTPDWGATFQRSDVSRITARATQEFDSFVGRDPDAYSTSLRFKRADGTTIDTVSFTLESLDGDGDGIPESYGLPHSTEVPEFYDAAFILALPADAARIELIRRRPGPLVTVTDVLELTSTPITVTLLEPVSSFFAHGGRSYDFSWRIAPLGFAAKAVAAPLSTKSYVFLSGDNGATWEPLASYLSGDSFTWKADQDGRYLVRVFATSGFETSDARGASDFDGDGCSDARDPNPQVADQDGPDADGVAQVCDLCPLHDDPLQGDRDHDGVGNACDNCADKANPGQADSDQDGHGSACDCSDISPGIWEVPAAIQGVRASKYPGDPLYLTLSWNGVEEQAGPEATYQVVSGSLDLLGGPTAFTDARCLGVLDAQGTRWTVWDGPSTGHALWYLVRGAPLNCAPGTYDSGAPSQVGSRDPLIAQSQQECFP